MVSPAYLWLLIFLLAIWIPACASYSLAFVDLEVNKGGMLLGREHSDDSSGLKGEDLPCWLSEYGADAIRWVMGEWLNPCKTECAQLIEWRTPAILGHQRQRWK